MLKNTLWALSFLLLCSSSKAQLQRYELYRSYSIKQIQFIIHHFGVPKGTMDIRYPVDIYKVYYTTPDVSGQPTTVTGTVAVPRGAQCPLPLYSYQHGTRTNKENVPSHGSREIHIGAAFAGLGGIIAMPDGLGLGDSPGQHPYLHSPTEASSALDLLRCVRQLTDSLDFHLNEQLFLFGYSQGGHWTLALQKYLEEDPNKEFEVTASAPLSGPYELSGAQTDMITREHYYSAPAYLPYLIRSYQMVYGNIYDSLEDIFLPPYDSLAKVLFDGTHSILDVNNYFPHDPRRLLRPHQWNAFKKDPNHPLRKALIRNDLHNWVPKAPTRFYFCSGDEQVTYQNSLNALDTMRLLGAEDVDALNFGDFNHRSCVRFCVMAAQRFFADYVNQSNGISVRPRMSYPHGTQSDGTIRLEPQGGEAPYQYLWSTGDQEAQLEQLSSGYYQVTLTDARGCRWQKEFDLRALQERFQSEGTAFFELARHRVKRQLHILLHSQQPYELRIYNSLGELVRFEKNVVAPHWKTHVGQLSAGLYLVELSNEEQTATEAFIKQ